MSLKYIFRYLIIFLVNLNAHKNNIQSNVAINFRISWRNSEKIHQENKIFHFIDWNQKSEKNLTLYLAVHPNTNTESLICQL